MDGLKGGCGCALPLSFSAAASLSLHPSCKWSRYPLRKEGERERISNCGLLSNLHPHSRSLSLSVCPLEILSLGRADCTSAVGNICTTWKKRKRERRKDHSVCPLLPRHLDLVPLSFTFTFIVSSRAKGTAATEVASRMLSKFSWFRHDE